MRDLVQNVMLSTFQHFGGIGEGKLLHYMIRAARNRSISLRRARRFKVVDLEAQSSERLRSKGASAEALLDTEALYLALNRLPEKQRDAMILFEINGFSVREIAGMQGSFEGTRHRQRHHQPSTRSNPFEAKRKLQSSHK
ncbi:MAG: RNA polymerase sigma-70 factor (ECF subfamily) [Neolewinella sp.]